MKEITLFAIIIPLLICTFLAGRFSTKSPSLKGEAAETFLAGFGGGNSFFSGAPGSTPVGLGNGNIRFPSNWTADQGDEYRKTLGG